jgi:hypothetical protein
MHQPAQDDLEQAYQHEQPTELNSHEGDRRLERKDCRYYFTNRTCFKPELCVYRHCFRAIGATKFCSGFLMNRKCSDPSTCNRRHEFSEFEATFRSASAPPNHRPEASVVEIDANDPKRLEESALVDHAGETATTRHAAFRQRRNSHETLADKGLASQVRSNELAVDGNVRREPNSGNAETSTQKTVAAVTPSADTAAFFAKLDCSSNSRAELSICEVA